MTLHGETPTTESAPEGPAWVRTAQLVALLAVLAWAAFAHFWVFILIMAIVVSVFLHEMGHFLMAKRNGMKVTEFFIGFGPRLWSFRRGETEYGLKLIPAGAYVRIIGMHDLEEIDAVDDEARTYRSKSYGRRMPVVLAGPVMNLMLGFLIFVVVFAGFGHPSQTGWEIRSVVDESAASAAGLQPGDRIIAIDGQPVGAFDLFTSTVRAQAGTTVELTVDRDGQRITEPVTIGWTLDNDGAKALPPLLAGDRVIAVDGKPITFYADLVGALQVRNGPTELTFERSGRTFTTTVDAPIRMPIEGFRGFLGVSPASTIERSGPVAAVGQAGSATWETVTGSVQGIARIFSPSGISKLASQVANGGSTTSDASGITPVDGGSSAAVSSSSSGTDRPMSMLGIINVGSQLGESGGWPGVLALLATVNIFLGLINLVPLLPFDGGHIAVATYEEIRSRMAHRPYRVDMAKLMPVTYVVVLVMVGLFASTLYLDAVDPIKLSP